MEKIQKDIYFYYDKNLKNINIAQQKMKQINLKLNQLYIDNNIIKTYQYKLNLYSLYKKQLYPILVILYNNKYYIVDEFNQFDQFNLDIQVNCLILPNNIYDIIEHNIKCINDYKFEDLQMYVSDFSNKFFNLYPYKELVSNQYRLYLIKINDYNMLLEALSNLINLINDKYLILKIRGAK